jgi:membrane-bound lytic murein transglycosylase B
VQAVGRGGAAVAMGGLQSVWRVAAWRRTPLGSFLTALAVLVLLVGAAVAAGATLPQGHPAPPRAATAAPQPAPTPAASDDQSSVPGDDTVLPSQSPSGPTRPVDGLTGWAQRLSTVVGVPVPALKAYGSAQLAVALTTPGCHLGWTTLAGIGKVESDHGSTAGATLAPDGTVRPLITGAPLDGTGGRALVHDTDLGQLDGDKTYDRAIGPMQFLPATWQTYLADGDGDGVRDPSDLNDAALAAANYLCANGRDLARPADWWAAVLSYNGVQSYAQSVYASADQYGKLSRTASGG